MQDEICMLEYTSERPRMWAAAQRKKSTSLQVSQHQRRKETEKTTHSGFTSDGHFLLSRGLYTQGVRLVWNYADEDDYKHSD